jgi:hypothetical protein
MLSRRLLALLTTLIVVAVGVPAALAATKNGITPTSPKPGGKVAAGKAAVFTGKFSGPGTIYVHVCKKARKNAKGVICHKEAIFKAKKKGSTFKGTAKYFDFPAFWLNNPGTYYWQAFRISCEGDLKDCYQEGPVVRFRVS